MERRSEVTVGAVQQQLAGLRDRSSDVRSPSCLSHSPFCGSSIVPVHHNYWDGQRPDRQARQSPRSVRNHEFIIT